MNDVKIRYNTLCEDGKNYWRIIINGREETCQHVEILCSSKTTEDEVFDSIRNSKVKKHHISCSPKEINWSGDKVILK